MLLNLPDRMGSRTATHQLASRTFLTYGLKRTIKEEVLARISIHKLVFDHFFRIFMKNLIKIALKE